MSQTRPARLREPPEPDGIRRWGLHTADPRPFAGQPKAFVILPLPDGPDDQNVTGFCTLLHHERAELEVELGCPIEFVDREESDPSGPRVLIGPARTNPALSRYLQRSSRSPATAPHVLIDRHDRVVALDGPDIWNVITAFQLLRTAIRTGQTDSYATEPASTRETLDLIEREVGATYPAFALRGIDWSAAVRVHQPDLATGGADLPSIQRLLSDLQDAHTWARSAATNARLPYRVWASPHTAHLVHVPKWSPGWRAGARAGDELISNRIRQWWERTSATPRTRALVTGYRMLSGRLGSVRTMRVRSATGEVLVWRELFPPSPWKAPISWRLLPTGTAYLRIRGWQATRDWHAAMDRAMRDLQSAPRLLVDLRGNVGGSLIAAQDVRDRFLDRPTALGTIRFSRGDGTLGDHAPIVGTPPADGWRWTKPVRFLIDRQTYSASEDVLLGLQGLPHVQVVGERSGGGSGRPRTLRIGNDRSISISTALTYDRHGHCIEGSGIPIDLPLPIERSFLSPSTMPSAAILDLADRAW